MFMTIGKSPVASVCPVRVVAVVGIVPVVIVILEAIVVALSSGISTLPLVDELRVSPRAKLRSIITLVGALPT